MPDEIDLLRAEVERLKLLLQQATLGSKSEADALAVAGREQTNADLLADVLRFKNVRASSILRSALDFAIVMTGLSGEILSWSEGATRLMGWSEAEVLGLSAEVFFTPEDRQCKAAEMEMVTALRFGRAPDQRWHLRKDGSRFFGNGEMTPLHDEAGKTVGFLKILRDDTAIKLKEDQLKESEDLLRAYLEAMPNQVWIAHPDGTFAWFNQRVYADSGAVPIELHNGLWSKVMLPEDLAQAKADWTAALEEGEPFQAEFRLRDKERGYRWYLSRAVPIRDTTGRILQWIGTNTDIDDQKRVETENVRDRDRMWTLSQDLMLVCDFSGRIITVNPSATRLLGWEEDQLADHMVYEFLHPDDLANTENEFAKLSQGRTTLAFENRYRCKDGAYRIFNWTAVPEAGHIHAIGRDITLERAASRERDRS